MLNSFSVNARTDTRTHTHDAGRNDTLFTAWLAHRVNITRITQYPPEDVAIRRPSHPDLDYFAIQRLWTTENN